MPGWHASTRKLRESGKIRMIGIIQEQHPDRCRLFMQWKEMDWPILVDSLNLLEVTAVPITMLIDETGIIQAVRPDESSLKRFLAEAPPKTGLARLDESRRLDPEGLEAAARGGLPDDLSRWADYLVLWGGAEGLGEATATYERVLEDDPRDGVTQFRLGVAYRKRLDSDFRQDCDFSRAVDSWEKALSLDPNQYIWRRRIQQYGPRLDKPYPFYDWIHQAREAIQMRGETPVDLRVEPRGAEFAHPLPSKGQVGERSSRLSPDPEDRVSLDDDRLIEISSTLVASTADASSAVRVHLEFRPNDELKAHWNNEAEGLIFWVDAPSGWEADKHFHALDNPESEVSRENRYIEFEMAPRETVAGESSGRAPVARGYALYYVCEDFDGTCLYRRQNINVPLQRAIGE